MSALAAWARWGRGLLLWACVAVATAAMAGPVVDWPDLQPPAAAEDNPFAALSDAQVEMLREIVLAQWLEGRGRPLGEASQQRRAELIRRLAEQGIDADAMLAQREALMAQRRAAAETTVDTLVDQPVRLNGYLLPAETKDGLVTEFLLVPVIGACSHTPPPPPNQSVRVRPSAPYAATRFYEPVAISGTLRKRLQDKTVFVIDGALTVRSAYAMDDAVVTARPADNGAAAGPGTGADAAAVHR